MSPNPAADLFLDPMAEVLTRYGFEGRNATVTLPDGQHGVRCRGRSPQRRWASRSARWSAK